MTDMPAGSPQVARRMVLMRHAQAAPAPFGEMGIQADLNRPLTPHGRQGAARQGAVLRARHFVPDLIMVSPAVRTCQTLEAIGSFYGDRQPDIRYVNALYDAAPQTIRDLLYEVPDKVNNIMILAHNPGLQALVAHWAARHCPPDAENALQQGFPPAAMACFTATKAWNQAEDGDIRLQDLSCQ
ncbi:SixA phosphatase family protein [Komagataeibacter oboediens]|uniref:Phosphohistidine phosphatase n=1 Tax=Komagataeibacter oboediens TaxID=65958 RepID=A0ABS5SQE4_9PROT|nr:histidine phosphatase family protein [Komagataeibacter oboediens]MBL7233314.1 histidine phosphatase family protein [Komagataeibacter oboediens]MBT0676502.1 phosphohistidine phosphatase [Komagataeibacter oboediens]MBT0678141.1 phosphohistidine phosphatase [Komagataeibacter oboediens]MBV1824912.1 histidine phosphatase family protein [Komagataeibacter oboediens]